MKQGYVEIASWTLARLYRSHLTAITAARLRQLDRRQLGLAVQLTQGNYRTPKGYVRLSPYEMQHSFCLSKDILSEVLAWLALVFSTRVEGKFFLIDKPGSDKEIYLALLQTGNDGCSQADALKEEI